MIEIFNGNWKINDIVNNKNKIFIFGDNDLRIGKGGQAIIRDCKNTIGIRTKKQPNNNQSSFYNDDEYDENILKIDQDINNILNKLKQGYTIVFSSGGLWNWFSKIG